MNLPVFNAIIKDETDGIFAVSLVTCPATQVNWVAFNKEEQLKFSVDDVKHCLTAPLMLANTPIYRRSDDGFEYYIKYEPETLRIMAEKMLSDNTFNEIDFQHDGQIIERGKVNLIELYIKDETKPSQFDVPDGSIICTYKINDDDIWESVTNGTFNGFSLAGFFNLEETTEKFISDEYKNTKNKFMTILEQLKNLILEYEDTTPETTPENVEEVEIEATQETQEQAQEQFEENQEPENQEPETQEPETQEPEKNDEPEEQETPQEPQKTELETLVETLKGTVDGILSDVAEIKARLDSIDAVLATPVTTPIEETNFTIEENKYDAIAKAMANRK